MKYVKGIIATSHIDSHGDMLSPEGLKDMVKQINTQYIPIMIEHDPRIPPKGRIKSAKLIKLKDGHYAVEGIKEIFEEGDDISEVDSSREMPLPTNEFGVLQVMFDRSYGDKESQQIINDISNLLNSSPQKYEKKALEPISVLIIGGGFILGGIITGFFNKLGADAWDALKIKLKKLLQTKKKRKDAQDKLLIFQFTLFKEGVVVNTEVILTNPSDDIIENFLENGLKKLDYILPLHIEKFPEVKKIVFNYSNNNLSILFSVRKDAILIYPIWKPKVK
jgi:hypothetical protein